VKKNAKFCEFSKSVTFLHTFPKRGMAVEVAPFQGFFGFAGSLGHSSIVPSASTGWWQRCFGLMRSC
jgi:hypothetical protein